MNQEKKIVRNADNELAMPLSNENITIGYVDAVNGNGAEEIGGFVPTRHELLLLVRHWYRTKLDNTWFYFISGQGSSRAIRENYFAAQRINRVCELLGDDEVDRVIADEKAAFSKEVDPEEWNIFLHGDAEQWSAVAEKTHQKLNEVRVEAKEG